MGVPASISICPKPYDQSKMPSSYLKGSSAYTYTQSSSSSFMFLTPSNSSNIFQSAFSMSVPGQQQPLLHNQSLRNWWDCLELPGE